MGHIPRRKPTSGVQVVTDSASDIPEDLVAKHHIEIVPLTIRFGDKEFVDREELPPDAFWRQCAGTSSLPETAAPSPGAFRDAFGRAAASGMDGVVCVNISSGLSGTFQSASAALAALPDGSQVKLIDSTFGSMAHGLVVLAAAEAASAGASIDEVESAARAAVADIKGFFTLDTLENLRRGGRIGNAQALLGAILSIKPILENRGGVAELVSRQRTRKKALSSLVDVMGLQGATNTLAISHGDADDIDDFLERVSSAWPGVELIVSLMGAVLGTHLGKGAITISGRFPGAVPPAGPTRP